MTTTKLKKVLFSALCLVTSLSASAQYTVDIKAPYRNNYANTPQSFKLTELATALGTDTASLIPALDRTDSTHVFTLVKADGSYDNTYTGNAGEYWLSYNGESKSYGAGSWFIGFSKVDSADVFNVYAGNYPDSLKDGGTMHATAALVYGEKAVTFDITFEVAGIPKAETDLSKITVVGTASAKVHMYPLGNYNSVSPTIVISDMAEKLGCTKQELVSGISNYAYFKNLDEYGQLREDSLVTVSSVDGWTKRAVKVVAGGEPDTLATTAAHAYNNDCHFNVKNFQYNENDSLIADLCQFPNALVAGDSLCTDVYFMYGSNAYVVTYTLVIDEPPYHGIEDMTQVGDTIVTVHNEAASGSPVQLTLDPTIIADALGTTTSNMSFEAIDAAGSLTSTSTANNGGYWMTSTGHPIGWSTSNTECVWYVEPAAANTFTTFNAGHMSNHVQAGDTATTTFYFVYEDKYYTWHINYVLDSAQVIEGLHSVATKNLVIQGLPHTSGTYGWESQTAGLSKAEVNTLIGTTTPTFYSLASDTILGTPTDPSVVYSKQYTCDPTPGFYLTKDGKNRGWTSPEVSPWYISTAQTTSNDSIIFTVGQWGGSQNGDVYNGQFFLVNEETNDMITINLSFQIVAELDTFKTVGSSTQTLVLNADAYDNDAVTAVDFKPIADALGVDVTTLLQNAHGQLANGTYSEAIDLTSEATLAFDANGYYDNQANALDVVLVDNGDGTYSLGYYSDAFETGTTVNYNAVVMFQNGGSRYFLTLNVIDPTSYATGINGINAAKSVNGRIYDLSGRQISTPAKGQVYIQNGKKYVK